MALYRGYVITSDKTDRGIRIEFTRRPDLPILRQFWFFVRPFPETYALDEAKRRIDKILRC